MLKHYEIINRMSDSEKIHLLCDIRNLSEERYRAAGIPDIKFATAEEYCENDYPLPLALANTWDLSLIGRTADALVEKSMTQGADMLRMPDPKIKLNPYRRALSEDPFLAAEISGQYLEAAERAGMDACLSELGLHKDELEFIDEEPDERLLRECIEKPYRRAVEGKSCKALLYLQDLNDTAYETVNSSLSKTISDDLSVLSVCRKANTENTVSYIEKGRLFFEGAPLVAESALSRYKTLVKNIRQGLQTEEDLVQETEKKKVLSKEKLDEAMDQLLEFIFSVSNKRELTEVTPNEALMKEAVQKSVVLLKNKKKRLPFRRVRKIALVGDIAFDGETEEDSLIGQCNRELTDCGFNVIGMERGYEMNQFRSTGFIPPVMDLAEEADVIVVFLGLGKNRVEKARRAKKISLPANQMALLDCLNPYKDKVVAVMPADAPADIGVAENCAAILLAPFQTKFSASVLVDTLKGTWNPSGKLASTVYLDSEALYQQHVTYRKRDGLKNGIFIGYRYYDTAQEEIAFPFGHGLGYSEFVYSKLSVKNDVVHVTVKNCGKKEGAEIVQVYAGKENSAVLRPHKELCGFARVNLRPGEKRTLQIPLTLPEVYSKETEQYVTEDGKYTIYVGASVSDIRLSCLIRKAGTVLESDQKEMSDYIHTKSNIQKDNYKLEAKIKTMKRSIFNFVAGFAAIAMAVVLRLYCFYMDASSDFFTWFQVFLGAFGVILFIREAAQRNAMRRKEKELLTEKNEEIFDGAEEVEKYDAAAMFSDVFDETEQDPEEIEEHMGTVEMESLDFIDKEQTFENAAREFEIYARERGSKFRTDDCKKIFSALASSRLLIFSGLKNLDFQVLMHLLSDYFGTSLHIESVDDSYQTSESVLFKTELQNYTTIKTHIHLAMDEARTNLQHISLAGLKDVTGTTLPLYFTSYMTYIKNPLSNLPVKVTNELNAETSYYISPNLWFFMNLAEGEPMANIPAFIAENASVVMISRSDCEESDFHTPVRKFSYYQMDYLTEKTVSSYSMSEDLWKRVDRLEDFVKHNTTFSIGNKLWLALENFAYTYLACGGTETEALDEAVAAKLILPMMILLDGRISSDDRSFSDTIETIFGEDHADTCKKLIRAYEIYRAQNN